MKAIHPLLPEPLRQGLKTFRAVFAALVFQLAADQQCRIKLLLGDVDAEDNGI